MSPTETVSAPHILVVQGPHPVLFDRLASNFVPVTLPPGAARTEALATLGPRIRGIATMSHVPVGADVLAAANALEIIAVGGSHTDLFDLKAMAARGVVVTDMPRLTVGDVADQAFGLLLAAARNVSVADRFVRAGGWSQAAMPFGTRVSDKRLGIVGLGHIGRAIARRAEAFDMAVAYSGRGRKDDVPYTYYPDPLALAREVDILIPAVHSCPETRHMVDGPVLEALGPHGVIVVFARGAVDMAALVDALKTKRLAAAAVDAFDEEPCWPHDLAALPNVILSPHVGSGTEESRRQMVDYMVENLTAHFAGHTPPHRVV